MSIRKKRRQLRELCRSYNDRIRGARPATLHVLFQQGLDFDRSPYSFAEPNHITQLWGYVDKIDPSYLPSRGGGLAVTKYGLQGGRLSCYAVIEGGGTHDFKSMGYRIGKVLSEKEVRRIHRDTTDDLVDDYRSGMPLYTVNSDRFAIWLNLILLLHHPSYPNIFTDTTWRTNAWEAGRSALTLMNEHLSISAVLERRRQDSDFTRLPIVLSSNPHRFKNKHDSREESRDFSREHTGTISEQFNIRRRIDPDRNIDLEFMNELVVTLKTIGVTTVHSSRIASYRKTLARVS